MFEPLDSGVMLFDPDGCRISTSSKGVTPGLVHTRMALALLRAQLDAHVPSLWAIQIYAQRERKPESGDPLGQCSQPIPVLAVYLARYTPQNGEQIFLVQHMDQYGEYDSPAAVIATLEVTVARWMVEGLST